MTALLALLPSWAWRWLAILGVALVFGGFCYTRGMAHTQAAWDEADEQRRTAENSAWISRQVELGKIGNTLEERLNEDRTDHPVIAVAPERVRGDMPRHPAAATTAGGDDDPRARAEAAAIGEAIAHDARHYPPCRAKLTAAQASLKVLTAGQGAPGEHQ